jgi:hypothetical protein
MPFPVALASLETVVLDGCASEDEWPAQIAAAICAGVDYAIAHPEIVDDLAIGPLSGDGSIERYEVVIGRLVGFLQVRAPRSKRMSPSTDEALVGGVIGLVGDHLRLGRTDRLQELRPELVLLTLLPYLGFAEAQKWANRISSQS